jgi:hypothetical protein
VKSGAAFDDEEDFFAVFAAFSKLEEVGLGVDVIDVDEAEPLDVFGSEGGDFSCNVDGVHALLDHGELVVSVIGRYRYEGWS